MLIGLLNIQEFDDVMAPNFSMIGDISPDKDETMKIQAKVIRMWYGKPSKFSSEINSIDVVSLMKWCISKKLLLKMIIY